MTKQLLFYERAVPVTAKRHGDWSLEPRDDYAFTAHTNAVPLTAVEFPLAAGEYTIVFAGKDEALQPIAVLGLKTDENLYLDDEGHWKADYLPAFVRRYPFVFSRNSEDENKLILSIDEEYGGWNQEGRGHRLFDDEGKRTEYFDKIFGFVQDYQQQFQRTKSICSQLVELGLLAPMKAQFKLPSGEPAALTGFQAVDREKLKALPPDKLAELAKSNVLELIYVHLQSMRNLVKMLPRVTGEKGDIEAAKAGADLATDEPLH
jgi:hypothetical protein